MNIYAEKGVRVVFANSTAGYLGDQETAAKYMKVGEAYTVERTHVAGFHTNVELQEFPGVFFNSVMFDSQDFYQ